MSDATTPGITPAPVRNDRRTFKSFGPLGDSPTSAGAEPAPAAVEPVAARPAPIAIVPAATRPAPARTKPAASSAGEKPVSKRRAVPRIAFEVPEEFADALSDAHALWLAEHPEVRREKGSISMTRWMEAALRIVIDNLGEAETKAQTSQAIADRIRPDARRRDAV